MNELQTIAVEVTHLQMHRWEPSPGDRPADIEVRRVHHPTPSLNRFLYTAVGTDWLWHDRLSWTHQRWTVVLERLGHQTWIGYVDDSPAGYFELETGTPGEVEIGYFGLMPEFIGRGRGRALLQHCLTQAWSDPATERVYLDTCTLDHPRALPAYLAAGFEIERVETKSDQVPTSPLQPWPGAARTVRTVD